MADTHVYREALIEAKKLREVAEANARNALVEAVTPRVREFIEKHLMGEATGDGDIISEIAAEMSGDEKTDETDEKPVAEAKACETDKESKKSDEKSEETTEDSEDLILSNQTAEALIKMFRGRKAKGNLSERLATLRGSVSFAKEISEGKHAHLKIASTERILKTLFLKMMRESVTLRDESIRIAGNGATSTAEISSVIKEIARMAAKRGMLKETVKLTADKRTLKESTLSRNKIREADEGDIGSLDLNLDGAMGEEPDESLMGDEGEEGGSVEIPADLAAELMAALEGEIGGDEGVEDIDLGGEDEAPAEEEAEEEEEEEIAEGVDDDTVVEIDEAMLRKEISRMREAAGVKKPVTGSPASANAVKAFGGGSVKKEVFVDGNDSDLNVYAEVKRLSTELKNESRKNRALGTQLTEKEQLIAKLREQLETVNLFNAKLLYVNKLFTNENVTVSQRKKIITVLDRATSLKEVRLLFKGLSESLSGVRAKPVNEAAARKTGSSSKPMSAGSAVSAQDPQIERWATLAGIRGTTK